jgi:hypothetical protein
MFSCKQKAQFHGIALDVNFAEERLSDNLMTDMTCTWKTSADFVPMSQDLNVYVHFWHDTNLLFQADYIPEIPTSTWEPNQEYSFTQRIHIPTFIDEFDPDFKGEETLRLSVGLYSPYDRSGETKQSVLDTKLVVFPPPLDTPEIIFEQGWYDREVDPEAYLKQWWWTAKEARCIIDNPHRDALLVIRGGVNLEAVQGQKIMFLINDLMLDEFVADDSYFEKSYTIKKEMLGDSEEFMLTITTDKVFVPAQVFPDSFMLTITTDKVFVPAQVFPDSADERELGMQISFVYFR